MNRYKKIEFMDFSKGESKNITSLLSEIAYTHKVDFNERKKIKLARSLFISQFSNVTKTKTIYNNDDGLFYFVCSFDNSGTAELRIYCFSWEDPESFSLVKNFGSTYFTEWITFDFFYFNKKLILSREGPAIGTFNIIYANNTDFSTWFNTNGIVNENIKSHAILDKILYVVTDGAQNTGQAIYKSSDGINFSLVQRLEQSVLHGIEIAELNGFIYIFTEDIYRLENDILKKISNKEIYHVRNFANQLIIFDHNNCKLYSFDGTDFLEIIQFPKISGFSFLGVANKKLWFQYYETTQNTYFSINEDLAIIKEFEDSTIIIIDEQVFKGNDGDFFCITGFNTNLKKYVVYYINDISEYTQSGNIETREINVGEIIPKQIILRAKPLPTGTSVKVYYTKNRSETWENVIITMTEAEFKKKFTFPANFGILDFIRFKIEMITTDTTKTPEDCELVFLYLPIGLENAK